jgi:exopolysaccharide biosynthesis polyprenyl glycosylphosphotransferase
MALPPYDVRVRREMAQRRTLLALVRQLVRLMVLHALDALIVAGVAIGILRITAAPVSGRMVALLTGLMLIGLNSRGAYQAGDARRDPRRIASGAVIAFLATVLMSSLSAVEIEAAVAAKFAVVGALAIIAGRWVVEWTLQQVYVRGVGLRRAIVIGTASDADAITASLRDAGHKDQLIGGFVTPRASFDAAALGTLSDLEAVIARLQPAELIICQELSADAYRHIADISLRNGVSILAVASWTASLKGWVEPVRIGGIPGLWVHPARLEVPSLLVKRSIDLALATLFSIAAAPLILLIGLAIKLDSRGPVFFRQRRVGLGGRDFTMWKFRSMHVESESQRDNVAHLSPYADARLFKVRDDPRITRIGRLLRRFSLDELPQLINVIAGDMSLVGPRPPLAAEVARYEPRHLVRLSVVPGMTGPWQVGGRNLITDFEEVVRMEREYIERWSFGLDLKIMAKTIVVMLSGKGAY